LKPPKDKVSGQLGIGRNRGEIVMNLDRDYVMPDGEVVGHIVFSARQARGLARLLNKHAKAAEEWWAKQ
jgi:hypothetical protein